MSQKVLVFSDIHGNLPAFELMLQREKNVDLYISLGDVVNYGPWSNECVELLETLKPVVKLKGNHDGYFLAGQITERTSNVCSLSFEHIFPTFKYREILKNYQESYQLGNFLCSHAWRGQYVYSDSKVSLDQNYFVGHSHRQFRLDSNGFVLYNPGSVGQNREEISQVNYAVFSPSTMECELKSIPYDVSVIVNKMKKEHFPAPCIKYYQRQG